MRISMSIITNALVLLTLHAGAAGTLELFGLNFMSYFIITILSIASYMALDASISITEE